MFEPYDERDYRMTRSEVIAMWLAMLAFLATLAAVGFVLAVFTRVAIVLVVAVAFGAAFYAAKVTDSRTLEWLERRAKARQGRATH